MQFAQRSAACPRKDKGPRREVEATKCRPSPKAVFPTSSSLYEQHEAGVHQARCCPSYSSDGLRGQHPWLGPQRHMLPQSEVQEEGRAAQEPPVKKNFALHMRVSLPTHPWAQMRDICIETTAGLNQKLAHAKHHETCSKLKKDCEIEFLANAKKRRSGIRH